MIVEFFSNKRRVRRLFDGLLSVTLSLIIGLSSLAIIPYAGPTAEAATRYTSGYYTYELLDSVHAKIVGVDSNISGAVIIPVTLDGYTVSEIGDYAFAWHREVTRVTVPSGVTSINSGTFNGCSKLNYISLPNSLMYIKDWAFQNCDALTSVTIPDNVLSLGRGAFYGCDSLSKVTFGAKVSVLGDYLFEGCPKLSSFSVSSSNSNLKVSKDALISGYKLVAYPPAKATTNYTLPSGIASVGRGAFSDCKNLQTVTVSSNVVEISYYAFENCTNLTSVSLPSSVKKINGGAFSYCSSLKTIDTSNVNYLGYSAFSGCSSLTSISTSNVNHWDYSVFSGCSSLTSVSIPKNASEIPASAFYGCSSLKTITVPNTIKSVGSRAFYNCTSLSSFSLPTGITEIGSSAFDKTAYYNNSSNWSSNGLLYKGNYLLSGDKATGAVSVKDGCILIAGDAFDGNGEVTSIKVPDSVKYIGDRAFRSCKKLTNVELGNDVISIGDYAFNSCPKLTTVKLGNNVTQIGEYAFAYSENLVEVVLPPSVTAIAYGSFQGCTNLKNIHISDSIKKIDGCAFRDCDSLQKVYYFGTSSQYKSISVDPYKNDCFEKATEVYFYEKKRALDPNDVFYSSSSLYYLYGCGVAMDGLKDSAGNVKPDYTIPGLYNDMIPQGLTYYKEKNWLLISAYHKAEDGEDKNPSVVYALDFDTGEYVAQFNIYYTKSDGVNVSECHEHVGGIAVSDNNLYITKGKGVAYIPLSELDVPNKTVKDVKIPTDGQLVIPELDQTKAAYLNFSENVLWMGNFYYYTLGVTEIGEKFKWLYDSWDIPASKKYNSIMLGYRLSGSNSEEEWAEFVKVATDDPNYYIEIKNSIEGIQGATVSNGKLYLSKATWNPAVSGSSIYISEININKNAKKQVINTNNFEFTQISNLPGAENIIIKDGYLYSIYESAALALRGEFKWKIKDKTDVIWKTKISDLQSRTNIHMFNCPIDIKIYDKTTNQLVGKIEDNAVDRTIAESEGAVLMAVYGETKYCWLPNDKEYKVVITGNGTGTMDYTVKKFDGEFVETERVNFFGVDIVEGKTLTGEVTGEKFVLKNYHLDTTNGSAIKPEYINNESNYQCTITTFAEGTGGEQDQIIVTRGDVVSLQADIDNGVFVGWFENNVLVSTDIEYSFVAKSDRNLTARFKKFIVKEPSTTTISSGDSIILHADFVDDQNSLQTNSVNVCPYCKDTFESEKEYNEHLADCDGYFRPNEPDQPDIPAQPTVTPIKWYIKWEASNDNFDMVVSNDGKTCKISPKKSGETTFTATAYDEDGNDVGFDTQTMTSKAGFFDKIIAFFKKLFGLTKVIPQSLKYIY